MLLSLVLIINKIYILEDEVTVGKFYATFLIQDYFRSVLPTLLPTLHRSSDLFISRN
jgi:hypothetical protein